MLGRLAGFGLHAGVGGKANESDKLERPCRYISRLAVSEKRLSLTPNGDIRYRLKALYNDGTTRVILNPLELHCPAGRPGAQAPHLTAAAVGRVCVHRVLRPTKSNAEKQRPLSPEAARCQSFAKVQA